MTLQEAAWQAMWQPRRGEEGAIALVGAVLEVNIRVAGSCDDWLDAQIAPGARANAVTSDETHAQKAGRP